MSDLGNETDLDRMIALIEHAMDEAYVRYASASEPERAQGIAAALRHAVAEIPRAQQRVCLEVLGDLYAQSDRQTSDRPLATENARLRDAVLGLKREIEQMQAQGSAESIVAALLPADAQPALSGPVDSAAVADIVARLASFARELGTAFHADAERRSATKAPDRFVSAMQTALQGGSTTELAALLDEIKCCIGAEVKSFREAARAGAEGILKRIDPLLLEAEVDAEHDGRRLFDLEMFRIRRLWEAFQRRHAELSLDDLYTEYFDGELKAARVRQRRACKGGNRA